MPPPWPWPPPCGRRCVLTLLRVTAFLYHAALTTSTSDARCGGRGLRDAAALVQSQPLIGTGANSSGGHVYHLHIPRTAGTAFVADANKILFERYNLWNPLDMVSREGCFGWSNTLGGIQWVAVMLRNPRSHVLSQYLMCSESHISLFTSVPKGPGGFRDWVHYWASQQSERKVAGDFSAMDQKESAKSEQYLLFSTMPFKCYCPVNLQSHHLTCTAPYNFSATVNGSLALANMRSARFVGIQEAYHESLCLFYVKVKNKVPPHCHCDNRTAWRSFRPTYSSWHGAKTRIDHNISRHSARVLSEIDAITREDQAVYKAAVERFVAEVHEVEQKHSVKIICDDTLLARSHPQDPMEQHFSFYLRDAQAKLKKRL